MEVIRRTLSEEIRQSEFKIEIIKTLSSGINIITYIAQSPAEIYTLSPFYLSEIAAKRCCMELKI